MSNEQLKSELVQTMFRAKNLRGTLHGNGRQGRRDIPDGRDRHDRFSRRDIPDGCGGRDEHDMHDCFGRRGDSEHHDHTEHFGPHGFTASALVILRAIEEGNAPVDATVGNSGESGFANELQKRLHISKAAISQNLTALEKKGLISRMVNPHDLRRFDFTLTEKGKRVTDHLHQHMDSHMDRILERMGEEDTRELIRLFNKLVDIIEDIQSKGADSDDRGDTAFPEGARR
ncbi:MAG: MarR family transcriptional regulator [Coriobacteriales bacterium]|jgi:DNA-binding MarR family transcriptional regulator|nr:MarR family transcriptional regulator [Coriobacteriales bacterium]